MYATDVKKLIDEKKDLELNICQNPVIEASIYVEDNGFNTTYDLYLRIGSTFVVTFDSVKIVDPTGIELIYKGRCVAAMDVGAWESPVKKEGE